MTFVAFHKLPVCQTHAKSWPLVEGNCSECNGNCALKPGSKVQFSVRVQGLGFGI